MRDQANRSSPVNLERWQHSDSFGQEHRRRGETRTMIVIAITAVTMLIEVVAGLAFGSMALLADGLHMASHAAALGINALAYVYARRHAHDPRYSFGTGKVNALGGFTDAVLLAVFALAMGVGSIERLINPVEIAINQAIAVAVLGLIVNGVSVFILGVDEHHHDHPERPEGHEPGHGDAHRHDHGPAGEHAHRPAHPHHHHHHDHNLRSAYLHVLADALTSLLAIVALLGAKYFGTTCMDPIMGLVGTFLVTRWSIGLLRQTGAVLLDRQRHDAATASWKVETGEEAGILARRGRLSDLIVLAGPIPVSPPPEEAAAALKSTGRPVLIVPADFKPIGPRHVGIGWNGSAESARAVAAAMEYLHAAERVTIFCGTAHPEKRPTAEALVEYLGWHGVEAAVRIFEAHDPGIGESLLAEARAAELNLLVVGGYSRSRLRELMFGGVTGYLLTESDIPVFMVH